MGANWGWNCSGVGWGGVGFFLPHFALCFLLLNRYTSSRNILIKWKLITTDTDNHVSLLLLLINYELYKRKFLISNLWSVLTFVKTPFLQFTVFYHEHVFTKDPETTSTTPWHHDQSYYPVDGWKVKLNEWIAWIVYGHMIRMPDWEGIYCEMQRNWRKKLAWWKEGRGKFYNNYRSWIGLPRS